MSALDFFIFGLRWSLTRSQTFKAEEDAYRAGECEDKGLRCVTVSQRESGEQWAVALEVRRAMRQSR